MLRRLVIAAGTVIGTKLPSATPSVPLLACKVVRDRVCLSVCMYVCMPVCLSVCLSVRLSVRLA